MAWDPTPWVVGGGAEHSPEVARLLAYASTGGSEGIVEPSALRVRAMNVPGAGFRVGAGAALVLNRFAGGGLQTYVIRNTAEETFTDVQPTGSGGGRTDLIVARVLDPQYAGDAPPDPVNFQYVRTAVIRGVPSSTTSAEDLNLGYPAIALARIAWPSSTGTITNAMLTDLRRVAMPREYRRLFTFNLEGPAIHTLTQTAGAGQYWPNIPEQIWNVDVPWWATHANIVATWGGVRVSRSAAQGVIYVRLGRPEGYGQGNVRTQDQKFALDFSALADMEMRETWTAADDITVPAALRGTSQPIRLLGRRLAAGGPPRLDNASSILVDVQFTEGPA